MTSINVNIKFDNFHGLDERSSEKLRKIVEKPRKRATVKKISEGKGCNTIGQGEAVLDLIAEIEFTVECVNKQDFKDTLLIILKEIETLGYAFSYEFSKLNVLFFDGGIDEEAFNGIITKKRSCGCGKIENTGTSIVDLNTHNIAMVFFSLVCDNEDFIDLLFGISNDLKRLGYSFEIKGC